MGEVKGYQWKEEMVPVSKWKYRMDYYFNPREEVMRMASKAANRTAVEVEPVKPELRRLVQGMDDDIKGLRIAVEALKRKLRPVLEVHLVEAPSEQREVPELATTPMGEELNQVRLEIKMARGEVEDMLARVAL